MTNYTLPNSPAAPVDITLQPGDTVTATDGTLVPGDELIGAGNNNLILSGAGTFDLTQPAMAPGGVISGFSTVEESGSNQIVTLVAGMPVTINVDPGNSNETVTLADPGDNFQGGDSSNNTINVAASLLPNVTIDGGSGGGTAIVVTGNNTTITPSSSNLSNIQSLVLNGSGLTVDAPSAALGGIYFGNAGDTVTLDSSAPTAVDTNGGNTVVFTGAGQTLVADDYQSAGSTSVQDTIVGFNSTDTSDSILMLSLGTPGSPTVSFDGTNTTVQVSDGSIQYTFEFKGDYTSGDFSLAAQGGGYALSYSQTAPNSTAILTTGTDTVGSGVTQVIATDGTLTPGDQINPSANANLDLVGGGTFDLTQPGSGGGAITNIGSITVESAGANVTLLSGLMAPVTLSAAGNDTVTLANDNDNINANGGANDVFNVTPSQAEGAIITNVGAASTLNIDALTDGGGQAITLSSQISGIQYAALYGGANSLDPGSQGPALVYVEDVDNTGNNTIELTGNTNAAVDYGTGPQADNFFFDPNSSAPQVVTIAYEGAPTENLYGFNGNSQAILDAFDYTKGTPTLSVTTDTTPTGGTGVLLTVSGMDANGNAISQSLQLYGNYDTGDFTLGQNPGGGASITYSGAAPGNTLSNSTGQDISGVSDVYAAADQFGEGGSISTTSGGTLHLVGPGSFELNNASITGVTTIDGEAGNQTITLGSPSGAVTVNLAPEGHDTLFNLTPETTILGSTGSNNYGTTSPGYVNQLNVDLGSGINNQIAIDNSQNQSFSLTLDAPGITGVESFAITGDDGISIDTGDYQATTGIPINIDIADDDGSTLGADHITLEGNGDSVSDFFGGNFFTLNGPNEVVTDLRNGSSLSSIETISGFDQGASTNDTIAVPFPDTVGPSTGPNTESVSAYVDTRAGTTTLTLTGTQFGAPYTSQIVLDGEYGGTFVATKIVGLGNGWDITYVPCYRRGTRILAEHGEAAIETLKIGDRVMTRGGSFQPIRWIGRRRYSGSAAWGNRQVLPILLRAGSLDEGLPRRDLWVSPEHAMYVDGMLIPAAELVNGRSIVQETHVEEITYFHLEFDRHEVILAEGAWAESFVDDESRSMFDNAAEYAALYPDAVADAARFCAPRVEEGEELEAVRRRLARLAGREEAFSVAPAVWRATVPTVLRPSPPAA